MFMPQNLRPPNAHLSRIILQSFRAFMLFLSGLTSAQAQTFSAGIENSQWYLSSSIFDCSMTHTIPGFGKAVFFHEAGEQLRFFIDADASPLKAGAGHLVSEAPPWRPGAATRLLGKVQLKSGARQVELDNRMASRLMASLNEGMMPTLSGSTWYNGDPLQVRISAINFRNLLSGYTQCVSGLLPVNFRQVERTSVLFGSDNANLSAKAKAALDRVVLYVKADQRVTEVFVDGHTDDSGGRLHNRVLSKDRAETVARYLQEQGIAPEMITTRFHGDRYLLNKGRSEAMKSRNRRANVMLLRGNAGAPGQQATLGGSGDAG